MDYPFLIKRRVCIMTGLQSVFELFKARNAVNNVDKSAATKEVLSLTWPSAIELIMVTICHMIDMMMVGKIGSYAITAIGLTVQPQNLLSGIFVALNVGVIALVARLKGEKQQEKVNAVVRQALVMTVFFAVLVSIIGVVFSKQLIILMGGAFDTIKPGTDYFIIVMSGFILTAVSLCISAVLRGTGNTRAAMKMNISANIVNIFLNYILIYGKFGAPALGVRGAALGTVIGWGVACLLGLMYIMRGNNYIKISVTDNYKPDQAIIRQIAKLGVPSAGEQFAQRLGLLLYVRTVSSLGTAVFATHQIALNILGLSFMNGQAFGIAATTLVGRSLGENSTDRADVYARQARRLGSIVSAVMGVVFFFFGARLVSLYTDDIEIISRGSIVLKIIAVLQPVQSSFSILSGALRGAGDTRWPAYSTFAGIIILRPILSYVFIFIFNWGLLGGWAAWVFDQSLRFIIVQLRFSSRKWMEIDLNKP